MPLFFNRAGPSRADKHYLIDPLQRMDMAHISMLLEEESYFVLHAPRQTGKTTCLLALMDHLNKQGDYRTLYANIEAAQALREDVPQAIQTVCSVIAHRAKTYLKETRLLTYLKDQTSENPGNALTELLAWWAETSEKPTVLFLDEIDALVGDTLVSVLRQIRAGYAQRPTAFPSSIVLCGIRDVRDYRIHTKNKDIITGGSAFNIKATALRLGNLGETEVRALWQQHTTATGQAFASDIYAELWADTRGQPWLVNALGYQLTRSPEMRHLWDRTVPITLEDYRVAREQLIQSRATHLDQLTDKLQEPRVHRVITTLLAGEEHHDKLPTDDLQYVADLGLITLRPAVQIANQMYQEVIPRELIWSKQSMISHEQHWYLTPDRHLDMPRLLQAFQQFFREHSDAWIQQFDYKEAGAQLLLQAFLQRIVNGGGCITREYGLGRRRTDLYIEWPVDEQAGFHGEIQRIVLELKIRYSSLESTLADGLPQTADYATRCRADEAHLLIFDRRSSISWEDKIWHDTADQDNRTITVWGL